jgi:hypothetical protein
VSDKDCFPDDADTRYDPDLASKILSAIESYNRDRNIAPSPRPLRDTLLAIAALLHLDTAKAARSACNPTDEAVFGAFAEAAQDQLRAVIDVKSVQPPRYQQ